MENPIIITDRVKNKRISTDEVILSMEIGDYFMLDNHWIEMTKIHVLMTKEIFKFHNS